MTPVVFSSSSFPETERKVTNCEEFRNLATICYIGLIGEILAHGVLEPEGTPSTSGPVCQCWSLDLITYKPITGKGHLCFNI